MQFFPGLAPESPSQLYDTYYRDYPSNLISVIHLPRANPSYGVRRCLLSRNPSQLSLRSALFHWLFSIFPGIAYIFAIDHLLLRCHGWNT